MRQLTASPAYEQLDASTLSVLRQAIDQLGSITAVAARLDYSRPAISMALAGQYKGNTGKLRARILSELQDGVACPHLGQSIPVARCHELRALPLSTSNRDALKQWQACQACPHGAASISPADE